MKKYLNFNYKFCYDYKNSYVKTKPKTGYISVDLPHFFLTSDMVRKDEFSKFQATYMKDFTYSLNKEEKVYLNIIGCFYKVSIYLNSKFVGTFLTLGSPIKTEITSFLKENNYLVLVLDYDKEQLSPFKNFDEVSSLGIFSNIYLSSYERIFVDNLIIDTDNKGNVKIKSDIETKENSLKVIYQVYDNDSLLKETNSSSFSVNNIKEYEMDNHKLYTLKMNIKNSNTSFVIERKIGFRHYYFNNHSFYLNNKKVDLVGLKYLNYHSYLNKINTISTIKEDLLLIKKTGVNLLLVDYTLINNDFLNVADELGIMIITTLPELVSEKIENELKENYFSVIKNIVNKAINHCSFLGYYVPNLTNNLQSFIKDIDAIHYLFFKKTFKTNFYDKKVLLYNLSDYFKFKKLTYAIKHLKSPVLLINDTSLFSYQNYDRDKIETIKRIYDALLKIKKDKLIAGHILFDAFDSDNDNGIYDENRNIKDIFFIYKTMLTNTNDIFKIGDFYTDKKVYVISSLKNISLFKNNLEVNSFKNSKYDKLSTTLITIDDYVGKSFSYLNIDKKYYPLVSSYLNDLYLNKKGINVIYKLLKIKMFTKLKKEDLNKLLISYSYIDKKDDFEIVGYKNNKNVVSKVYSYNEDKKYEISLLKSTLINDKTYDVSSLHIRLVDKDKHLVDDKFIPLSIKETGAISIYGPNMITLTGGQASIYFRSLLSKKEEDIAKITIVDSNDNKFSIDLNIKSNTTTY